jgi:hypothetical protein
MKIFSHIAIKRDGIQLARFLEGKKEIPDKLGASLTLFMEESDEKN